MKHYLFTFTLLAYIMASAQVKNTFQVPNEIVQETQRVISIGPGQKIDTAYFKTLFLPTADFTVVGKEDGKFLHETMNLNEFVETLTDTYYSLGYHEKATGEIIEEYNGIAQIIQSFEGLDSENERGRGVGSYQLVYSDGRWWIANMVWTMSANNGEDIPGKYLSDPKN